MPSSTSRSTSFLGWLDGRHPFPAVHRIFEVHLGDVAGVPFGFTDAAVTDDGRVAFLACAEARKTRSLTGR